jgi:hypothetical protein
MNFPNVSRPGVSLAPPVSGPALPLARDPRRSPLPIARHDFGRRFDGGHRVCVCTKSARGAAEEEKEAVGSRYCKPEFVQSFGPMNKLDP